MFVVFEASPVSDNFIGAIAGKVALTSSRITYFKTYEQFLANAHLFCKTSNTN